jgi:apolipoprotein D and lipocalin family protein
MVSLSTHRARADRCVAPGAWLSALMLLLTAGCVGAPDGIEPVTGFELDRYLGKWYEIARLDHSFERGLSEVTAEYALRDDGGVSVLNRGYLARAGKWKEADGKAYFVGDEDVGQLKVSFFGPFYGGYNVVALDDEDYAYSMVVGPTRGFLWILAREPMLPARTRDELVARAAALGFDTDDLIFVEHGAMTR